MEYFLQLFELLQVDWLRPSLTRGIVTSASAGTEGLVRSIRFALLQYINNQNANDQQTISINLLEDLVSVLENSLDDDRYAIPTVDILGFLLDNCFMRISIESNFK